MLSLVKDVEEAGGILTKKDFGLSNRMADTDEGQGSRSYRAFSAIDTMLQ